MVQSGDENMAGKSKAPGLVAAAQETDGDVTDERQAAALKKYKGISRLMKASYYSYRGFVAAFRHEEAFRLEMYFTVVLLPLAFILPVTQLERVLLILVVFIVLIVELLNSGIEAVVDRVGFEYHELAGRAKDIASAAVFLSIILWAFVWFVIVFPVVL